jgi:hypothetical protein
MFQLGSATPVHLSVRKGAPMFSPRFAIQPALLVTVFFYSSAVLSQQKPAAPGSVTQEFPVTMQQNVVAGKTAVGAKVEAKLTTATLVNGVVVPRNAVFSGEVIESAAKSDASPAKLGIRMDSVKWKNGSLATKVYLTAWYYPVQITPAQNLSYGPPGEADNPQHWNGLGPYPGPGAPAALPFPNASGESPSAAPSGTTSNTSTHRVLMKNVQYVRNPDGSVAITSRSSNIKLDKSTAYVLASGDLLPRN